VLGPQPPWSWRWRPASRSSSAAACRASPRWAPPGRRRPRWCSAPRTDRHCPTATAVGYGVAAVALLAVHTLAGRGLTGALGLVPGSAWVVVPFSLGLARRLTTEARARARTEAERRLIDSERLRLAQEVHDIVGHG